MKLKILKISAKEYVSKQNKLNKELEKREKERSKQGEYIKYKCRVSDSEAIVMQLLAVNNIHGNFLDEEKAQTTCGDIRIDEIEGQNVEIFADIKSFKKNTKGQFCLAIDLLYYECDEYGNIKYKDGIPLLYNNNGSPEGWVFHLEYCDVLILINTEENVLYIVENFQNLREKIINTINTNEKELGKIGNIAWKVDENIYTGECLKVTKLLWVNLRDEMKCHSLGIQINRYKYEVE